MQGEEGLLAQWPWVAPSPHAAIDASKDVGRRRDAENPLSGESRMAACGTRAMPGEQGWTHKVRPVVLGGEEPSPAHR